MLERNLYAAYVGLAAMRTGDTGQLAAAVAFLEGFRQLPGPRVWLVGARAVAAMMAGEPLSPKEVRGLYSYTHEAAHCHRLLCARALTATGHPAEARQLLDGLLHPEAPPTAFSHALGHAALALHNGEVSAAADHLGVALTLATDYLWPEYHIDLLELLAIVASLHGLHERAGRLVGAAERIREGIGAHYRFPDQASWIEKARHLSVGQDGPESWDVARTEGRKLTVHEALAYASRARGERQRPVAGWDSLTPTEHDVVRLVAEGLSNPQIAERLLMGRATVKTHVSHALSKLGVSTRTELAAEAIRRATP